MASRAMREFFAAYVETALWSSTDESTPSGGDPLDENYGVQDIAPATLSEMERDARNFYASEEEAIFDSGLTPARAGHDFWLSRNGHGAGFFDEGAGLVGDHLQDAAERYGEYYLYVGDDGMIHGS